MFIAELGHERFDDVDLSSLRTGIMAGSPCPMEIMKQVIDRMGMTEVSIAYGMALTTVFPVVYETLGDLRSAVAAVVPKGTPFLEQIPALFNERMAYSLVPFVDKVVLAVCLLALWLGYYFLIAKAKDVSGGEYRPSLVMFDLFQGMILLFTAKSISAFSHDVS